MHTTHTGAQLSDTNKNAPGPDDRSAAISALGSTRHPARIERLADELTMAGARHWTGSSRRELIEALILCLTSDSVRQDADAEDAICSSLEQIGVMSRAGNLVFAFVPDEELATRDLAAVRRYRAWLPVKYTIGSTAKDGEASSPE